MINENITNTDNFWTNGFEITFPSSMRIAFGSGTFSKSTEVESTIKNDEGKSVSTTEEQVDVLNFNSFAFDIVPHDELDVIYDVYLLTSGSIHVDRTEIGEDTIPFYEGNDKLLYILTSFLVPPLETDADNIDITINKAVRNNG